MRNRAHNLAVAALAAFVLAGCGGGGSSPASSPRSASAATPGGLTATLTEDRSTVAAGGASVRVTDAAGTAVYPDPSGGGCTAVGVGAPVTLAPGQLVSDAVTPGVTLPAAGRYSA